MNSVLAFAFGGLTACVLMRVILGIIQLVDARRTTNHGRERRRDRHQGEACD